MKITKNRLKQIIKEELEAAAKEKQFPYPKGVVEGIWSALRKNGLLVGTFDNLKSPAEVQRMIQILEDQNYAPAEKGRTEKTLRFAKYLTKDKDKLASFAKQLQTFDDNSPFAVFARLFVNVAANDSKLRAMGDKVIDAALSLGQFSPRE